MEQIIIWRPEPPKEAGRCDLCSGELEQRVDDNREVILKRLEVYVRQTQPLESYYQGQGKLIEIDGEKDKKLVLEEILKVIS